jgi:hypothetical protein
MYLFTLVIVQGKVRARDEMPQERWRRHFCRQICHVHQERGQVNIFINIRLQDILLFKPSQGFQNVISVRKLVWAFIYRNTDEGDLFFVIQEQ